jgi:apolipoprotein N-acyltransferase
LNLALSVLSGVLLILLFPRFGWTWLAPVALTPILIACARERSWKLRALNGLAAGFVFWFGVCYWIQFVLEVHGGMGRWGGWGTFLLFAFLKGLHMALFAALAGFLMPRPWAIPAIAALWTGIERTHGPLGFAWVDLGNAAINMPVALRLAPLIGVYGISFVFAALACGVALIVLRRPRNELVPLAALILLPFLPALPEPTEGKTAARVVQPNVDTEAEWTIQRLNTLEQRLAVLSHARGVDLIVWPEVPAPFYPSSPDFRAFLTEVTKDSNAPLLFGGVARTPSNAPLNSAFLADKDGKILDRYDKIKLVPFGEFVPEPFGFVNRITNEAGDFAAGSRIVIFNTGSHRIGAFICYESAFPDLVRQFTRNGAQVLMNLSNDGYFGTSAALEQHLSIVRMRAAENRRWLLRATNDGITVVVDPAGRVTERLPEFQEIAATMHYNFSDDLSPYVRFGDWFAWACLAASLALVALQIKNSKSQR